MSSGGWTRQEHDRIADAEELVIAARRADGTLRPVMPIRVVRVGDDLYVRSWRGMAGAWYRAARREHIGHVRAGGVDEDVAFVDAGAGLAHAVDAAYQAKYARYPGYVPPMRARTTTLRLVPASGKDRV